MNPIMTAAALAKAAHEGQTRRYNGTPYVLHPARVAARTMLLEGSTEHMAAAAFLHDVLEDTTVTPGEISIRLGPEVTELVQWLTNPSKGMGAPRAERKRLDREHLARAPWAAKVIKMLDRLDNLGEMKGAPADFKRLYSKESLLLAEAVGDAYPALKKELTAKAEAVGLEG